MFEEIKRNPVIYKKMQSVLGARQYLNTIASRLAVSVLKGSKRMALLMENEIPDYQQQIRQSVRPDHKTVQKKLGIPMIYGSEGTPWHKVLILDDNSVKLAHYKDILCTAALSYYSINNHILPYIDLTR